MLGWLDYLFAKTWIYLCDCKLQLMATEKLQSQRRSREAYAMAYTQMMRYT